MSSPHKDGWNEELCVSAPDRSAATGRWDDLSEDEQARVTRLLTIDPDDNLADVEARCKRALQIIRGEKP